MTAPVPISLRTDSHLSRITPSPRSVQLPLATVTTLMTPAVPQRMAIPRQPETGTSAAGACAVMRLTSRPAPPASSDGSSEPLPAIVVGDVRPRVQRRLKPYGHIQMGIKHMELSVLLRGRDQIRGVPIVDLHGPSIPTMLGLTEVAPSAEDDKILPIEAYGMKVISVAFFLPGNDDPVIWRGPLKQGAMQQFLGDVLWGELDDLVVDCPPGTGDEPLGICQLIPDRKAVIVTTPQEVAAADVRRSVNFCRKLDMTVLGVVENMSGFVCPHCQEITYIFKQGGGEALAKSMDIPFLGRIPLEPIVGEASDAGRPFVVTNPESASAKAFAAIVDAIAAQDK